MIHIVDYLSTPKKTDLAKRVQTEKDAINLRQSMDRDFMLSQPRPDQGFQSSPSYARIKKSYRASYPPSQREGYYPNMNINEFHSDSSSRLASSNAPVDTAPPARPRRSSLRQPTRASDHRRRDSLPAKQVRFSMAETIYEPFEARDVQTIDQILALLHVPSHEIPPLSSHSVVLCRTDAAHAYPEPVVHSRDGAARVKPLRVELVDGYSHSQSHSRSPSSRSTNGEVPRERTHSRTNNSSRRHSDTQYQTERVHHHSRSDSQHQSREGTKPHSRSGPHSRLRGCTVPPATDSSPLASDETLIDTDLTWAPATSIMLAKQRTESRSGVDMDQPVVYSPKESSSLRRADAQRLPTVPRRHKLLRNLARMFE